MNILGIETSCDETAAAVVKDGRTVLSNVVYTQIPLHVPYGGVVPEIASRAHVEKISEVVRAAMPARDGAEVRGPIVIATVKGDIHDIGKNICRALLENYGFKVIDLGRDVAPEAVVAAALREKARLVGLSALMTTTVGAMEETVRLVHERVPGCLVTVGGAVLTEDYARKIGADNYSKDAMCLVRYAESLFGEATA